MQLVAVFRLEKLSLKVHPANGLEMTPTAFIRYDVEPTTDADFITKRRRKKHRVVIQQGYDKSDSKEAVRSKVYKEPSYDDEIPLRHLLRMGFLKSLM